MQKKLTTKVMSAGVALILTLVAATAVIAIVYVWDTGLIGPETWESEGISLEYLYLNGDTLIVCVRNTTDAPVSLDAIYLRVPISNMFHSTN